MPAPTVSVRLHQDEDLWLAQYERDADLLVNELLRAYRAVDAEHAE